MNLNWDTGAELIIKALKKTEEDKAWDMWLTLYPNMDKKTFIPFSDFFKQSTTKQVAKTPQTKDEILAKAEELRLAHQGKHEGIKT
jgi:glycerol-3-phosphate O-acyltransferase